MSDLFNVFSHLSFSLNVFMIVGLGVAIGVVLGATGAGGAILSVPLLTLVLHLTVNQAGPIGLLAVTLASAIALVLGLREGIVRYKAAGLMAGFGLVLSPLGFWLSQRLPNVPLVLIFSGVLLWVGVRMWRSSQRTVQTHTAELRHQECDTDASTPSAAFSCIRSPATGKFIWTLPCARALAFTGALAGFMSGLIGVGGGFIIVPSLKKNTNLEMRSVVATSLAVITLVSAGGVLVSASRGLLDWSIALPFASGTMLGMLGGQRLGKLLSSEKLSQGFAVLAMLAAGLMLARLAHLLG